MKFLLIYNHLRRSNDIKKAMNYSRKMIELTTFLFCIDRLFGVSPIQSRTIVTLKQQHVVFSNINRSANI